MQLGSFTIQANASLRETLLQIEKNQHGLVFVVGSNESISAVATDGDIRRYLLKGGSLEDAVKESANIDFVWKKAGTPREDLLKALDQRIRVIPLLDEDKKLVGVVSRTHLPPQVEGIVYARSRAPVRISFSGGGSDLTHYFSKNQSGAVINATISLYTHATLRTRKDGRIVINSTDLGETLSVDTLDQALNLKGRFELIQSLLKVISPDFGFELYINSDFPMRSGLGGSAVVAAAILGCFNQFRRDKWDLHEIAEIAYQAERHYLGVAGGWQDQYAAVFGGFNFMEFRMEQNIVHPLRIYPDTLLELEECLILCDTGKPHDSGDIHEDQRIQMSSANVQDLVAKNVQLSYKMRNNLLRGRLDAFGKSLDEAWQLKRQFSEKISSSRLDKIYDGAMANGAFGGKILGAGGGGFFLFFVSPFEKQNLISYLQIIGLKTCPFRFDSQGLQSWLVRESTSTQY